MIKIINIFSIFIYTYVYVSVFPQLDLDSIWTFVFGVPASQCATTISGRVSLCPEAAITILAMVRAMLNQEDKGFVVFILMHDEFVDL